MHISIKLKYRTTLLIDCCVRFQWQWRVFCETGENMSIFHLSPMHQYLFNSIGCIIEILSILIDFSAVNRLMLLSAIITSDFLDEKPLLNVVQLHTISIVSQSDGCALDQIGHKFCPRQIYKCDIISSTDVITSGSSYLFRHRALENQNESLTLASKHNAEHCLVCGLHHEIQRSFRRDRWCHLKLKPLHLPLSDVCEHFHLSF